MQRTHHTMVATEKHASKNTSKPHKGAPRAREHARARTPPSKPAPPAELSAGSDTSDIECQSPQKECTSKQRRWHSEPEVAEFFQVLAESNGPLFESEVEPVVKFLSDIKRPLTKSEFDQLFKALGISTFEAFRVFVSYHFPEKSTFSVFTNLQIRRWMNGGNAFGQKWRRYEKRPPNEKAVQEAYEHREEKLLMWNKAFEQTLKNTQTEEYRQNELTSICVVFRMPPDALRWLAFSRAWYTLDPNDFTNRFWQQLEEAEKKMHAEIQKALSRVHRVREEPSTPGERKEVLSDLSATCGYEKKNMLSAFASDTEWNNIKTGGEACGFKLACDHLLAQCKKKQEQAREDFHKAMLLRDEIVQIRLKALHHLVSAATKYSTPRILKHLAYTDIFDTYDPADPNDVFTQILEELRDYGESTVASFFIGE